MSIDFSYEPQNTRIQHDGFFKTAIFIFIVLLLVLKVLNLGAPDSAAHEHAK